MNKLFYKAFEDKQRGSREMIKTRAKFYLPFILPLKEIYPDGSALDIGCGRGEWLELLKENGVVAQGIDLDGGMLEDCFEQNLDILKGDGFEHLKTQKDNSLTIISAFHIVEHITFEILETFVSEAQRVLKPGGLLIIETPNPENIKVATEDFYLDPTHKKPIPSQLLYFLVDFYGFERTKVIRLQENKSLVNSKNISLFDVMSGASPDYSVIAQKTADDELLNHFEGVFSRNFGLSLEKLTKNYDDRLCRAEAKAKQAEAKAKQVEERQLFYIFKKSLEEAKQKYYIFKKSLEEYIFKSLEEYIFKSLEEAKQKYYIFKKSLLSIIIKPLRYIRFQLLLLLEHGLFARVKAFIKKYIHKNRLHSPFKVKDIEDGGDLTLGAQRVYKNLKGITEKKKKRK